MSDETDIGTEDEPESKQGRNWKALRDRADTAEAKVKDLEGRIRKSVFREAGFDPDSGVGKMLASLYTGDLQVEALKTFAKDEYGVEPGGPGDTVSSPAADLAAAVQARLDKIAAQSTPLPPPGGDDAVAARILELEAKGDSDSLMEAIALRDEWRKRQT